MENHSVTNNYDKVNDKSGQHYINIIAKDVEKSNKMC